MATLHTTSWRAKARASPEPISSVVGAMASAAMAVAISTASRKPST